MQRLANVKNQASDDLLGVQLGWVDSGRAPSRRMGRITAWLNVTAVLLSLLLIALYWRPIGEMLRIIADRQLEELIGSDYYTSFANSVLIDAQDNVWFSSADGVFRLQP